MSQHSAIGWTEATWNPVTGCSHVSPGCEHCYAETLSLRIGWSKLPWTNQNAAENVKLHEKRLIEPLRWKSPQRVFVNSMSDLFHELVPDGFVDKVFAVMALARQHDFQVLTKRPERMRDYCRALDNEACSRLGEAAFLVAGDRACQGISNLFELAAPDDAYPFNNIWLGTSVEDQRRADERIPVLLETPAAVRFISAEPLLGPLDLSDYLHPSCECELSNPVIPVYQHDEACPAGAGSLDWVILGGETGREYRPMNPEWAENLAAQCIGIPLFAKQDSGPRPGKQGRLSDALWSRKEYPLVGAISEDQTK